MAASHSTKLFDCREILRRIALGGIFGAIFGLVHLLDEFSWSHLVAASVSGAVFTILIGLAAPWWAASNWRSYGISVASGAIAGFIWWVVVKPQLAITDTVAAGAVLGGILMFSQGHPKKRATP